MRRGVAPVPLSLPADAEAIRELSAGDEVRLSGRVITGRAPAHRLLATADDPALRAAAAGAVVYHCSPLVIADPTTGTWRATAAGPSPSAPMEPWQAAVLERLGLRGVLGRGGMGPATRAALARLGAVYLHALGGLAVGLARRVARVAGVHGLDALGAAEAIWVLELEDFPAVVTMDARGESLHDRRPDGEPSTAEGAPGG